MKRIAVLKGGTSSEREVSLVSGAAIAEALRNLNHTVKEFDPADYNSFDLLLADLREFGTDIVFIGLHGGAGENGEMQAALSLSGIKYTGSGSQACALTMDKYVSKLMCRAESIPTADFILMRGDLLSDYGDPLDYESIADSLDLPIIVKPNDGGSSVGISKIEDIQELKAALKLALQHSESALLEKYIPGQELTVTVLDGKALPLVEIRPLSGWYDYTNKYSKGKSEYLSPAPIAEEASQLMQTYAERLWQVFGLKGYARIDFRYNGTTPYFLEVNTLPGMTPLSLTPMAAKSIGMSFGNLVELLVNLALKN